MVENLCTCFACTGPALLDAAEARVAELERELANVRAGVWAAETYLERKEYGMVGMQLRGCLPDDYTPVGA